jgi:hypothetical protein
MEEIQVMRLKKENLDEREIIIIRIYQWWRWIHHFKFGTRFSMKFKKVYSNNIKKKNNNYKCPPPLIIVAICHCVFLVLIYEKKKIEDVLAKKNIIFFKDGRNSLQGRKYIARI